MIVMEDKVTQKFESILDAPTCYPEKERKTREQRYADLVYWYETYNDVNEAYNLWGMDCTDACNLDEWLDRGLFRKQRHDINAFFYPNGSKFPIDYTVIMRDKRMFEGFAEMVLGYGNQYSPSIGFVIEKEFSTKFDLTFTELINKYESKMLVFKQVFGCSADTVKVVHIRDGRIKCEDCFFSPEEFFNSLSIPGSNWIIQEFIEQHPIMKKVNKTSVNTLRIITFHVGDKVECFPIVMLRYGYPGKLVDNSSLCVGVNGEGIIMESAFNWVDKSRIKCHAVNMNVPYFGDAIEFAKYMHKHIPEIFTIGWDICITPNGPHLIEGNDGWDNGMHQSIEGCRMRKFYNEMLAKRHQYYNK